MDKNGLIEIPGVGAWSLKNIVFDFNGTIAAQGNMQREVLEALDELAETMHVYVITADTYGTVKTVLKDTKIKLKTLEKQPGYLEKKGFIETLGPCTTVAVGNGRNDREMLKVARLGIAVIGQEGTAIEAILNADIVVREIMDAIKLVQNPKALIATLRD